MCGPIALMSGTKKQFAFYNLGRMFSYVGMGFLFGWFGQGLLESNLSLIKYISLVLMAAVLMMNGLSLINPNWISLSSFFEKGLKKFLTPFYKWGTRFSKRSGFMLGFFSGFLPCGWLYTFLIAGAATKNPFASALTLFLFWLGTLPALSAVTLMLRKPVLESPVFARRISGLILILAGLYALWSHIFLSHQHSLS
jgi:sulfite exporter TauE/SafE